MTKHSSLQSFIFTDRILFVVQPRKNLCQHPWHPRCHGCQWVGFNNTTVDKHFRYYLKTDINGLVFSVNCGYMNWGLVEDKNSQNGLMSCWGKTERKYFQRPLSCVYINNLQGSESGHVPILPLPPASSPAARSLSPFLPSLLCWPAPLGVSRGRFLPQLGVLACVAACLSWSVDFLVAACTYLNIPPAAALFSGPSKAAPSSFLHPSLQALSFSLFHTHAHFLLYPVSVSVLWSPLSI